MSMASPIILGFSDSLHDRSVCLFEGAKPLVAIEEERLSRVKHGLKMYAESRSNPELFAQMNLEASPAIENEARLSEAITYCLNEAGITMEAIDIIVGNSLHTALPFRSRAVFLNHHLAHACSAFFPSGFEEAAILVSDGYGDQIAPSVYETVAVGHGRDRQVRIKATMTGSVSSYYDMQNSLGVFYRIGTLISGFGLFDEGKTMGLSAYGRPKYRNDIDPYISFDEDGVRIDNGSLWHHLNTKLNHDRNFELRADVAATFQEMLNEMMLHYARIAYQLTKSTNLCIAGGVGLNCVANSFVLEHSPFKNLFVVPAPGDNGISFGAASFAAHQLLGLPRLAAFARSDFGRVYCKDEIRAAVLQAGSALEHIELEEPELIDCVAKLIAADDIVMWFHGGSEVGPRALGHRSILANPKSTDRKDYINSHVKFREGFRPLAPITTEEDVSKFFDIPCPSPFMLFAPRVKSITQTCAPGIVHADGTARLQTVSKLSNGRVHALVCRVKQLTGTPIILNTSFNGKDEPIVESPEQAIATFMASPLRYLVLEDFLVTKRAEVAGIRPEAR